MYTVDFIKKLLLPALLLSKSSHAARPFVNEPDTGQIEAFGEIATGGTLPSLDEIVGLPDFDYIAGKYLNVSAYTRYRLGAAGEYSYRNNLEAFAKIRLRPRVLVDVDEIESSLHTTILGHNFSAPFFIAPAAQAGWASPKEAEIGLVKGAADASILIVVSEYATKSQEEIQAARAEGQVMLQHLKIDPQNDTATTEQIRKAEANNFMGIIFTVDTAAPGNRHRSRRYAPKSPFGVKSSTWDYYQSVRNRSSIPVILKGIQTWEDAVIAANMGVEAIYLSNHGARQLDGSPSGLEVALEIHEHAPWVFKKTEVWADGGVRYGTDVLKLLALGVKAVGLARPFFYANMYGAEGVAYAADLLKNELVLDGANLGIPDIGKMNSTCLDLRHYSNSWGMK